MMDRYPAGEGQIMAWVGNYLGVVGFFDSRHDTLLFEQVTHMHAIHFNRNIFLTIYSACVLDRHP